jgi:hypothetical protein
MQIGTRAADTIRDFSLLNMSSHPHLKNPQTHFPYRTLWICRPLPYALQGKHNSSPMIGSGGSQGHASGAKRSAATEGVEVDSKSEEKKPKSSTSASEQAHLSSSKSSGVSPASAGSGMMTSSVSSMRAVPESSHVFGSLSKLTARVSSRDAVATLSQFSLAHLRARAPASCRWPP